MWGMSHLIDRMPEFQHYLTSNLLIKPRERRRETGTVRRFTPFIRGDYWSWAGYLYYAYACRGLGRGQKQLVFCSRKRRRKGRPMSWTAQNRETLEDSVVTSRLKACPVLSALLGGIVGSHMKVNWSRGLQERTLPCKIQIHFHMPKHES